MIAVPFDNSPAFEEPPLSWKGTSRPDGSSGAIFTCPNGHTGSLEDHEISEDGSVTPSVVCTQDGCDFHEYIKLEGWPKGRGVDS